MLYQLSYQVFFKSANIISIIYFLASIVINLNPTEIPSHRMKSLILMGYMGCGKSALGKQLAQASKRSFVDLDQYIEQHENTSISKLFESKGELYFRKKERFYLEKLLSSHDSAIIALGGGTPCYFDNIDFLNQNKSGVTCYLKTTPKILAKRLFKEKDHRPMIAHLNSQQDLEEFIAKHLFERIPYYTKAQYHLSTDEASVEELSQKVHFFLI